MVGYIIIGIFAVIIIYIAVLYFINSRKMKNKAQKSAEKTQEKSKDNKVEVESSMSSKTPIETAILEENSKINKTEIEQAFSRIDDQRLEYENYIQSKNSENDKHMTELERSLKKNSGDSLKIKHMSSETAKIGREGPSKKNIEKVNQEIAKRNENQSELDKSLAKEIENLSPELKAVLLNDILNRKY